MVLKAINSHPAQDRLEECGFKSHLQYVVRNDRTGESVIYGADQKEVAFSAYQGRVKSKPKGSYSIRVEVVYTELLDVGTTKQFEPGKEVNSCRNINHADTP